MVALDTPSEDVFVGLGPDSEIRHQRWTDLCDRARDRTFVAVLVGVQLVWAAALLYAGHVFISS